MGLFKKCLCASPVVTARRQPRGPSALTRLGKTKRKERLGKTKRKERRGKTKRKACLGKAQREMSYRTKRRGPSALACLGKTKKGSAPREDKKERAPREGTARNVVPNEVRGFPMGGASLTLGRTKKGARQDKKGRSAGQKRALGRMKKGRSVGRSRGLF